MKKQIDVFEYLWPAPMILAIAAWIIVTAII